MVVLQSMNTAESFVTRVIFEIFLSVITFLNPK